MESQRTSDTATDRLLAGPDAPLINPPLDALDPHSAPVPFRLLSLPPELTLLIASFLPSRSLLALLRTSSAFAHLSSLINALSRQDHTVRELGYIHIYTPLQFFSAHGIESVVRRLLSEGADPNDVCYGPQKQQLSPLTHAVNFHSASIVALLLRHGAKLDERDSRGDGTREAYSPLDIAVGRPHDLHPRILPDQHGYMHRAWQIPQIVQLLIDAGADFTSMHPRRGTPLHMACAARDANPRIVAALIAAGADVHSKFGGYGPREIRLAQGMDGDIQPIHYAASAGNVACVRLLLDAGADIEAATRNGIRPLDNAVLTMRTEVLVMLLAAGADERTSAPVESLASGASKEVRGLMVDTAAALGVADPWMLVKSHVGWRELAQWLLLRGCEANWDSMSAWGMTESLYRYRRNECFPFN